MTTSSAFQMVLAPDLFQRNECVNLTWSGIEPHPDLAAITIMLTASVRDDRADLTWACLRRASSMIERGLASHTLWLCASDCGENNRMTRHRALWRGLAMRGFKPTARQTPEMSVEIGDGSICFFGAAELQRQQLEAIRPIVTPASRSFLSWMPSPTVADVEGMVAAGWMRGLSDLQELGSIARVLSSQGGVVLRLFGEFDDRETGVDCIMSAENYKRLSSLEGWI